MTTRQQLEYTAPTGFRFLDEPMFCFSTLNANMNPNPNPNCRPGHRPWPLTPWRPAWAPTLAANTVAKPAGHRPWPLTRLIAVSSQGRCPGRLCHGRLSWVQSITRPVIFSSFPAHSDLLGLMVALVATVDCPGFNPSRGL